MPVSTVLLPLQFALLWVWNVEVYVGETDMKRQSLNVYRMNLLGAKVTGVASGTATLKDAINEAFRVGVKYRHNFLLHRLCNGTSPLSYNGKGFPESYQC